MQNERQHWMAILARADKHQLQQLWQQLQLSPDYQYIRRPETGLAMVRGRVGGNGKPFNATEVTLTRCTVRLAGGTMGVSYVLGRSEQHAKIAALADALLQESASACQIIKSQLLAPLEKAQAETQAARARDSESTRVDFFTLVRGEN